MTGALVWKNRANAIDECCRCSREDYKRTIERRNTKLCRHMIARACALFRDSAQALTKDVGGYTQLNSRQTAALTLFPAFVSILISPSRLSYIIMP